MEFPGRIAHLEIDSPYGNAGGVIKNLEDVEQMALTGVGWEEDGTHTVEPRSGLGPDGEFSYDEESGYSFNAEGFPGPGLDRLVEEIPERVKIAKAFGKCIITNVGPVSDDPGQESIELVHRTFDAGAQAVLLNVGCRNILNSEGRQHSILSYDAEALEKVLRGLVPITEKYGKIFIRTSPFKTYPEARKVYKIIANTGVVGAVFTPNSFEIPPGTANPLKVRGDIGSMSGPSTANHAKQQLVWALAVLKSKDIDVISSGGIDSGRELARRIFFGAVGGCGTTIFRRDDSVERGWSEVVDKILREYADAPETHQSL